MGPDGARNGATGRLIGGKGAADIARVAPAENDPCRRIERGDDAEREDVVWQLVDDAVGAPAQPVQSSKVSVGGYGSPLRP